MDRRRGRRFIGAAALLAAGCSSLAPKTQEAECAPETEEADCGEGFICDEPGFICRDASRDPPLRYLGFVVQEAVDQEFRAELIGCDSPLTAGARGLRYDRGQLTQTFILEARLHEPEDPNEPELSDLLPARFTLSQPSRLAPGPTPVSSSVDYPLVLPDQRPGETSLQWPRYHPDNYLPEQLQFGGFVLWTIEPKPPAEGAVEPALRYQMIVPPLGGEETDVCELEDAECCPGCAPEAFENRCVRTLGLCRPLANPAFRYRFDYLRKCNRTLGGRVVSVTDPLNPDPVPVAAGTQVRLRHDDTDGQPRLGVPAVGVIAEDPQCQTNAGCIEEEQLCNEQTGQCELALAGRPAGQGATEIDGAFTTQVYSYCDDLPNTDLTRTFDITVRPPAASALPVASFRTDVEFRAGESEGQTPSDTSLPNGKALCLPSMGVPRPLEIAVRGAPVELLGRGLSGGAGSLLCCDLSCLPADRDAAELPRPDPPAICDGSTANEQPRGQVSSDLVTSFELAQLWLGEGSPCLAPDTSAQGGVIATLSRNLECSSGQCLLEREGRIAAGTAEEPRQYTLRVVTPEGSLHQSIQATVLIDESTPVIGIDLPPRRLLRGFVDLPPDLCDPAQQEDGDCGSEGAWVIAERLAMPTETIENTPEPYFHEVSTFYSPVDDRDGAYILPLDPGVWLVTALPQTGTAGGPAPLGVVDLREGVDDVIVDFTLEEGVLVTLDVKSFDIRSAVTPLDTGSWTEEFAGLEHPARRDEPAPDRFVDLSDPDECLSSPADGDPPGCFRIRRLTDTSTSLPLTQVGQVRFTARKVGERHQWNNCDFSSP